MAEKKKPEDEEADSGKGIMRTITIIIAILAVLIFLALWGKQKINSIAGHSDSDKAPASSKTEHPGPEDDDSILDAGLKSLFEKKAPLKKEPIIKTEERIANRTKWSAPVEIPVGKRFITSFRGDVLVRINGQELAEHINLPGEEDKLYAIDPKTHQRIPVMKLGGAKGYQKTTYGDQINTLEFMATGASDSVQVRVTLAPL